MYDQFRRLLRHGSCAFARLYSLYHEGLYSATMFLTAALYSPIRHLLMEDEKFLDIEPDKVLIRCVNEFTSFFSHSVRSSNNNALQDDNCRAN